jgi:hypothetical protein
MAIRERPELDEVFRRIRDGAAGLLRRCADFLSPSRKPDPDPLEALLASAPTDNEPVTGEDAAAIETARKEHERGETVSLADIKRAGA